MSYLDNSGVAYLWSKIKDAFAPKSHSHDAGDITSGTLDPTIIPFLDASSIGSGTLPIARGGTGQGVPTSTAVIANVATAGANCEITQVGYWQWGMVAQLYIAIKVNAAKSSGNVIATLVAGKEPCLTTPLMNTVNTSQFGAAYANGQIQAKSSLSSGTTVYLVGTYILKP